MLLGTDTIQKLKCPRDHFSNRILYKLNLQHFFIRKQSNEKIDYLIGFIERNGNMRAVIP